MPDLADDQQFKQLQSQLCSWYLSLTCTRKPRVRTPSKVQFFLFFQPLFTAIGKITAHLPGLLFYLIIKFCVNLFLHI